MAKINSPKMLSGENTPIHPPLPQLKGGGTGSGSLPMVPGLRLTPVGFNYIFSEPDDRLGRNSVAKPAKTTTTK